MSLSDWKEKADKASFNEHVAVRCNKCGEEFGFFPRRVVCLRPCSCGNGNWGSPIGWWDDDFGDFTLVERSELVFVIPTLFGDRRVG